MSIINKFEGDQQVYNNKNIKGRMMKERRQKLKTEQTKSMKTHTDASWLKSSFCQSKPVYIAKIPTARKKKSSMKENKKHYTQLRVQTSEYKSPQQLLDSVRNKNSSAKHCQNKKSFLSQKKYETQSRECPKETEKLRVENIELLQRNQQLLYEKQYLKQKLMLREIQCRELQRKLDEAHAVLMQSHRQHAIKHKKAKTTNQIPKTEKSSMLLQGFEEQRSCLAEKHQNNNIDPLSISWARQTQNDFNYLLESVDKENNEGRKVTLRKMLANKAMEMKKVKKVGQSIR